MQQHMNYDQINYLDCFIEQEACQKEKTPLEITNAFIKRSAQQYEFSLHEIVWIMSHVAEYLKERGSK